MKKKINFTKIRFFLISIIIVLISFIDNSSAFGQVFFENFEKGNLGEFQSLSVKGDAEVWSFGSNAAGKYAKILGGGHVNEDWLISPNIDLRNLSSSTASFKYASNYGTDVANTFELLISTNYNGDVSSASWTNISASVIFNSDTNYAWENSPSIDLSGYDGSQINIAFKFTSDGSSNAKKNWRIDDFKVEAVDNKAPIISAVTISEINNTTAVANVVADEEGTLYYVALENTALAPNSATIKLGESMNYTTANSAIRLKGLARNKSYKIFSIVEDTAGNVSDVFTSEVFTTKNPNVLFSEDFQTANLGQMTTVGALTNPNDSWYYHSTTDLGRYARVIGDKKSKDEWLITPSIDLRGITNSSLSFSYAINKYGTDLSNILTVLVSTDYSGDGNVASATWIDVTSKSEIVNKKDFLKYSSWDVDLSDYNDSKVYIAFRFVADGTSNANRTYGVDNIEVVGFDLTAPVIDVLTISDITKTTAKGSLQVDEAGTAYWLVQSSNLSVPDAATIKAASQTITYSTAGTLVNFDITGLSRNTSYKLYAVIDDASSNESAVKASLEFTTSNPDETSPVIDVLTISDITKTTAKGSLQVDEAGTAYWLVQSSNLSVPDAATIKAANQTITYSDAGTLLNFDITGLSRNTSYKLYAVIDDASSNESAVKASLEFTTSNPDETLPVIDVLTISDITKTTAKGNLQVNEAGMAYWLVQLSNLTVPDAATIKAANQTITYSTAGTLLNFDITGLSRNTSYKLYAVIDDASSNESAVKASLEFTTSNPDETLPVILTITLSNVTKNSFKASVEADETGIVYWMVLPSSSENPSISTLQEGLGGVVAGYEDFQVNGGVYDFLISGLSVNIEYVLYAFIKDEAGNNSTIYKSEPFSSLSTGIEDFEADKINVYTNDKKITVSCDQIFAAKTRISVISLIGRKIYEKQIDDSNIHSFQLDCPSGIYIVRIVGGKQNLVKKVLLK